MLQLLLAPAWAPVGRPPQPLPATVPAALLVVLAATPEGFSRTGLADLFWPGADSASALHHLRTNLHRARQLLAGWGAAEALQADRQRLRLTLPTDLQALDGAAPAEPPQWLHGWQLPGFDDFQQWSAAQAQACQRRWQQAWRLRGAGPAGSPPPGRAALMASLATQLTEVHAVLLEGEAGIGKSTLLRAAWPDALCLRGMDGLQGLPYQALLDALRPHLPLLQAALADARHPLRPYRLDLARLLPELAPDEPLPALDALTAQARLAEALARAVEPLGPLLLVDDLQWCDDATVRWLLMLAHTRRLRWVAAARPLPGDSPLAAGLDTLRSAGRLAHCPLPPLPRDALATVCAQRWPQRALDTAALDQLHLLSGGNPFLLGELVEAGADALLAGPARPDMAQRVQALLRHNLQRLGPVGRQAAEAAAVLVRAVPAQALRHLAGVPDGPVGDAVWQEATEQARRAGLLEAGSADGGSALPGDGSLRCRHDLVREAIVSSLTPARRAALHRHAALWLAGVPGGDALEIAGHWQAAGEPQTALAWQHQAAARLKDIGRYGDAALLWTRVAEQADDTALALRARLDLAGCDLLHDLARGHASASAVLAQLPMVADAAARLQIEARARTALVDNRVFAGDLPAAQGHARRLADLLDGLADDDAVQALEVLIELHMREPDIPAAWRALARLQALAPGRPSLLSFEGQIHWFGGQPQAAHDALARLLQRHPDHARGLTIENDLAVMLHALGRLDEAEAMARRSLASWAGVPHTETLSLLVLGAVHTSAGRHAQAQVSLLQALAMAREQASAGFEAEAQVRLARSLLMAGDAAAAVQALAQAAPLLRSSPEPLRVSQSMLLQVLAALALGQAPGADDLARLADAGARSSHPLVHTRLLRAQAEHALAAGDTAAAEAAALRQAALAAAAGLPEPQAEALLVTLRARHAAGRGVAAWGPLAQQAEALARRHGLADLQAQAAHWLAAPRGAG